MKIVDGIIAEGVFDEQKAEEIWSEWNGRNGIVFKQVLQVKNGKAGCMIDHAMRKSHQLV
jgi:hypothetical protein